MYALSFIFALWRRESFSNFLNVLRSDDIRKQGTHSTPAALKYWVEALSITMCSLYIFWPTIWLLGGEGRVDFYAVKFKPLYEMYLLDARRVFFLKDVITFSPNSTKVEHMGPFDHTVTVFYLAMEFWYFFLTFYTELLQLFMSFTLSRVTANFVSDLRRNKGMDKDTVEGILRHYAALKRLGNHANAAVGRVTLFQMIDSLLYLPLGISNSLTGINWFTRLNYIFFICSFFLFTMHAASSPLKIQAMRNWLQKVVNSTGDKYISQSNVALYLDELSNHPVGFRGEGMFTITFGLVGSMASIMITHSFILLQFGTVGLNGKQATT
ncbi:uncharacterized protein LOC118438288 [Folsomia candida]|nr:uncharacterized protein LOC118438288 [Folsomia candida]